MTAFADAVIAELREFAADLLEPGLAPAVRQQRAVSGGGSLSLLLGTVDAIAGLVPHLLEDLDVSDYSLRDEERPTSVPVRAVLPRRAQDYALKGGRLVPQRWTTYLPVLEADVRPLGWLAYLLGLLRERLDAADGRLGKHIEEALRTRRGSSVFALADAEGLRALQADLQRARSALDRANHSVYAQAGSRLAPSALFPKPLPRAPSWATLRRLAEPLLNPFAALPAMVRSLFSDRVVTADLPFLYQRWCGVKVVQMLAELGFEARDDPAPALFLGGRIRFVRDGVPVTLWCEPRITREADHECGLFPTRAESTPDFVFGTPGPGGDDAFILDPTLDEDQEVRAAKSRYLSGLAFRRRPMVAGVPAVRHPLRAWAAAPLPLSHCSLDSSDGSKGTIPMDPLAFDKTPLRHWLRDIAAHATAWTLARA